MEIVKSHKWYLFRTVVTHFWHRILLLLFNDVITHLWYQTHCKCFKVHDDISHLILWQHTIQWYNDFVIFHAYVVSFTSSAIVSMSRDLPFVTTSCTFTFISWAMCPRKEKMTNPPKMLVTPSPIDTTIESLWGSEHWLIDWLI